MKILALTIATLELDNLWLMLKERDRNGLEGSYRHFSKHLFQYGLSIDADQDFIQGCIQKKVLNINPENQKFQKGQFDIKNHLPGPGNQYYLTIIQIAEIIRVLEKQVWRGD